MKRIAQLTWLFAILLCISDNSNHTFTSAVKGSITKDFDFVTKKKHMLAKFEQEIAMTRDPELGYVPIERLVQAREKLMKEIAEKKHLRAAIAGINWINQGPDNVGGRTRAILFDPNDLTNKKVFAGGVSGGLWVNNDITNVNSSWTKIDDFLDNLTINTLAADPNNSMIFYAGTGEAFAGVTPGAGIFKSTDGGSTWSHLASTSDFNYVTEIIVRNEGGTSVIYAGNRRKFVGSQLNKTTSNYFLGSNGLYRSANGGTSWTQVMPNNDDGRTPSVDDIGLDNNGHLWAATGRNSFGDKGGDIYECVLLNCDNTGDFTKKYDASANDDTLAERTVIALSPSSNDTLYAIAGKNNAGNQDVEFFIKSFNGGTTWSDIPVPLNVNPGSCATVAGQHFTRGQATYDLVLSVHPTNPGVVLLGGIDLYRTTNAFTTTTHIGSWYQGAFPCDQYIHADHHAIVFRPGNPNEVVFGTDGGVDYSTNAGNTAVTWPTFTHHVKDYNVTQFYAADISPTKGDHNYLGGTQDNGTHDWDGTMSTTEAVGGDGAFCHIDQTAAGTQIGSYIYNDYTVTTNDWATSDQVTPITETGRFINPSDYDDTNNILYAGSLPDSLCRILNVGTTNDLTDGIPVVGAGLGQAVATTIRVDRNTPTTIYVGNDYGEVYKIQNAHTGASLTSTFIGTGLPADSWVSSIDVQKGNSSHMLVTLSNFGVQSVWESTDGGTSWANVDDENTLPDIPVRWGIFSPANPDHALIATDLGVWSTDNLNGASTNWGVTNMGLANVRTDMLRWRMSDSTVVVATHGRGIYTHTFGQETCESVRTIVDNPAMGTYEAGDTIHTNLLAPVQVTSAAIFDAGGAINLNKLFEVTMGATFEVKTDGCN